MNELETLQQWFDESRSAVFFGGAGLSTESGIPDFRSVDGIYNMKYDLPPETIISHTYYDGHREEFFRFYRDKMLWLDAKPNAAHKKLAELEAAGHLADVVTQNIDGLHQAAGSKTVWELHGSVHRNYCRQCRKCFDAAYVKNAEGEPRCDACGGPVKPDVVLYEEGLSSRIMRGAINAIEAADMLIIGGTSLAVYPAAGLIDYYEGHRLVLINKTPTPYDSRADLILHGAIGELMSQIRVNPI